MERYELNKLLENLTKRIESLTLSLNVPKLKEQYESLLVLQSQTGFWDNVNEARKNMEESNEIKERVENIENFKNSYDSISELLELVTEDSDDYELLIEEVKTLDKELSQFELVVLLNGPYDNNNCVFELHAGSGGTEAMDWCMMLYRMYTRHFTQKRYNYEILDYQPGEEAGLKSVSMLVKGKNAFGYLKSEDGVHRLVRISPFDSNKRRHTSFAACVVIPEIKDTEGITINDDDLRIDVFRSGGAGGQHVNTTDSAVRITHLPTGIVVTCQNERSQIKNRETAMTILKSRLIQLRELEMSKEIEDLKGELKDIAWGSQIRSYVFHPYQMVKDHRTNVENGKLEEVMDGNLDMFIDAYLRQVKHGD